MDETALWTDMVAETTIEKRERKEIVFKSAGHKKERVSVRLAVWANGKKLKLFIIFAGTKRRTKCLDQKFKTKCAVRSLPNAWMNEELVLN